MDINRLLLFIVGFSCSITLVQIAKRRASSHYGWIVTLALVLIAMGGAYAWRPDIAGYVGGAAWAMLVIVPSILIKFTLQSMLGQRYRRARVLAHIVRIFHPADGWRELPPLLNALQLGVEGRMIEASAMLTRYNTIATPQGRLAAVHLFRLSGQWEACVSWFEQTLPPGTLDRDPSMVIFYIRALGEIGRLNDMLRAYDRFHAPIEESSVSNRIMGRLYVLAFCGRRAEVEHLFRSTLADLPSSSRRFWTLTANLASGREGAREELKRLGDDDATMTAAVEHRLTHLQPGAAGMLGPTEILLLDRIARDLDQEERYGGEARTIGFAPIMCYVLMAMNVTMFIVEEFSGGSEKLRALVSLGALVPELAVAGEWWRLGTAMFLHFGFAHVAMNMLGLWILGPYVERSLGRARFLFTYLMAGLGSQMLIVLLARMDPGEDYIYLGASGCVMALVGATAAILLRGWRREHAPIARRRLSFMIFIVAAQTLFDLSTPHVSSTAHLSGAALGFVIASLLRHQVTPRTTTP